MRYSIMLQLVTLITLVLVSAAAMFSWLQSRSLLVPERQDRSSLTR